MNPYDDIWDYCITDCKVTEVILNTKEETNIIRILKHKIRSLWIRLCIEIEVIKYKIKRKK